MKLSVRDYERDKQIVQWYEQDNLTFEMIGKRLNITPARVMQLYWRIVDERKEA